MSEDATPVERFASATVARLATVGHGRPHLVPISFALWTSGTLIAAVDHKPKRTTRLKRLQNIAANPQVSVLVDRYDEDWRQLWWARADGLAQGGKGRPGGGGRSAGGRYEQYRDRPPQGPFIVVEIQRFSGWSAAYSRDGSNPLQQ